jgi:hypothetical protein|tara:strand:- start:777 stop:1058 length:282 start_codon:yes stop_codon:yes gene_type:complete
MCTETDWVDDLFDEMERMPNGVRFVLWELMEQVYIEDEMEEVDFIQRIWDEDLDQDGVAELFRRLNERRVPVRDQYAPSQRAVADWIRSFCFS